MDIARDLPEARPCIIWLQTFLWSCHVLVPVYAVTALRDILQPADSIVVCPNKRASWVRQLRPAAAEGLFAAQIE